MNIVYEMIDLDALLTLYATPPAPEAPSATAARVLEEAETGTFPFEDTAVHTYVWGPVDGPVCLMMHGWGSKAADLVAFVRPLTRRGWRILALDAPAHGATPGSGGARTTSMLQFTRLLRAYAGARGGVEALLGHSIGAAACCYATSAAAPVDGSAVRAGRLVLLGVPTTLASITRSFLEGQRVPEDAHAAFSALIEGTYGLRIADVTLTRLINDLSRPVLMAHDRQDEAASFAEAETLAGHLPDATFVSTDGLGHAGLLTAPSVLRAVTAFLGPGNQNDKS